MTLLVDSFWRAAGQTLQPKVIGLSLLPLFLVTVAAALLGYFFWTPAEEWMRAAVGGWPWLNSVWGWLDKIGAGGVKGWVAPFLLLLATVPLVVLVVLLIVATMMTPTLVAMVGKRQYPALERKKGGGFAASVFWSLSATGIALVLLVLSMPLWLIPPLILIVPPLIWGWLTYRVMAFDAMAEHASSEERRAIFKRHRSSLLIIGVLSGYLGAAPAIVWASGLIFAFAFVVLVPVAIWIYTLVFAFSSLWFAHYCLAALEQLRLSELSPPQRGQGRPSDFQGRIPDHESSTSRPEQSPRLPR
ncbi:MAG: EI24 domain-containing protein [Burkholderiales bacterium]